MSSSDSSSRPERKLFRELLDFTDPNRIVTKAPAPRYRLRYFDVTCLVLNRMIGTGIFESPRTIMIGTNSTGVTLLFWFAGIFYCLAGAHVYVEYGLNVPRYIVDGVEQSIPRSGADLHYLQYVYSKPRYKKDTVLLSGCLFGISFICIGNMAGNCILCALRLLQAAHPGQVAKEFAPGQVRGIAIAIAVFACFIHSFSRRGGILLNNILALVKVGILLLIIGMACAVGGGGVHDASHGTQVPNTFGNNTSLSTAFADASGEANGYAQAFLSIIFAFSGFDMPNYVLGEISTPRKTYPLAMFTGVGSVALLYMAVNLCYVCYLEIESCVAHQFFDRTFGVISSGTDPIGTRVFNVFLAISSFGNIVVMTYAAARMKQEIAKQGFLPWPKFFAQNKDVSLGRFLRWLGKNGLNIRFLNPDNHSERTPVGAFVLHFFSCLVLIFATYGLDPNDAYTLLTGLISYLTTAFFGLFLALGILILRFRGPPRTNPVDKDQHKQQPVKRSWADLTRGTVYPGVSIAAASIYLIGNAYPIITNWVRPSDLFPAQGFAWYLVPMISFCVLGFGGLWFLGFLARAYIRKRKRNEEFVLQRHPEFDWAEGGGEDGGEGPNADHRQQGGLVLIHETINLSWPSAGMDGLAELQHVDPGQKSYQSENDFMTRDFQATTPAALYQL
ncbi:amino acid permease-domain-containing protein [Parachaetomium inaequale]|uniref:Amino acid permease-domain-containing protein n=1 Tax=Parachaetomium inaequale TaxID=2588326 RepID=A0AAN6SMY7_9PEZI|nr:amino acid permease-domain-containing protein [Parachaetomium inaequale]